MSKPVQIKIESLDLGQILDGLRARREAWKNTAIYLHDGFFRDDAFVCEECNDAYEAEKSLLTISGSSAALKSRSTSKADGSDTPYCENCYFRLKSKRERRDTATTGARNERENCQRQISFC